MLDTSRNIMVLLPFPANHDNSFFFFLILGFVNCFSAGRGGIEEYFGTWEKKVFRGKRQSMCSQDQLAEEQKIPQSVTQTEKRFCTCFSFVPTTDACWPDSNTP